MLNTTTTQKLGETGRGLSAIAACDSLAPSMIKLVVREVAERAGIKSARDLSIRAKLPYESCRLLWNGDSRMIGLNTLERLCTLLDVPPGQLFDFKANPALLESDDGLDEPTKKKSKRKG
jgi:DNA-binding Xre family transcriptional regulator